MFYKCKSLKNINLSNFNFNNVIDMHEMFAWCTSLSNIDLSNFNANNVIYMDIMLSFCKSLTNINLSNFNINNVTSMRCMFDEIRESNCQCNTLNGNVSFSKKTIIVNDIKIKKELEDYLEHIFETYFTEFKILFVGQS